MAHLLGGTVSHAETREYGKTDLTLLNSPLFTGIEKNTSCWMSHTDYIEKIPEGFSVCAKTNGCPVAAMENRDRKLYGVQFHPEVLHTPGAQKCSKTF